MIKKGITKFSTFPSAGDKNQRLVAIINFELAQATS
jgi:hypothetical protein